MENKLTATAFDDVRSMASDIFGVPLERITSVSSPESIESWDSIQQLNLTLAIEEKFGLQLSPEEMEQMSSIGRITELIDTKLQSTKN